MSPYLTHLASALDRLGRNEDRGLADALAPVTAPEARLSPWDTWTLLCLIRHHTRQQWVAQIIRSRLGVDLEALAQAGALTHLDVSQTGLVPDDIEWEYCFHGRGCCLTNRVTGECIDVDFFDETAEWFDMFFFSNYLKSLKSPEFAEERLIRLYPRPEMVRLSIQPLVKAGLLLRHPQGGAVRLIQECAAVAPLIDRLAEVWRDEDRRGAAAAQIGDWLEVEHGIAADSPFADDVRARATICNDNQFRYLSEEFRSGRLGHLALEAIAAMGRPKLTEMLEQALQGRPSGTVSAALEIISDDHRARWHEPVFRLLRRMDPNSEIPEPHIWRKCAEYLLRRGYRTHVVCKLLPTLRRHETAEAALLAMEFAPDAALGLFRRALRSTIPYNRTTAAVAMAIIDSPWSRKELIAVLRETGDQQATSECRAALFVSHDAEARQAVEDWEHRNPHEPESEQFITFEELSLRHRDEWLQYEMAKIHDRVYPFRAWIPPKRPKRWWWPL